MRRVILNNLCSEEREQWLQDKEIALKGRTVADKLAYFQDVLCDGRIGSLVPKFLVWKRIEHPRRTQATADVSARKGHVYVICILINIYIYTYFFLNLNLCAYLHSYRHSFIHIYVYIHMLLVILNSAILSKGPF